MLSRLASRALTSPLAFFLAGVLDLGAFVFSLAWRGARRRLRAVAPRRAGALVPVARRAGPSAGRPPSR